MSEYKVSLVKYEKPGDSVRKAIQLVGGFDEIDENTRVFIKPNIVFWARCEMPKWGVITTSRVVEDVVTLLVEKGVEDITIGEGIVTEDPRDKETARDAWERLGYNVLADRHGVKVFNILERPFKKIDIGLDFHVEFNQDALESDVIINLPVLKTHAQAVVSLGIKNLKGLISIPSRKKFHNADTSHNLDYNLAHLPDKLPPCITLIDGIYTLERGPGIDGKARRSNLLVASKDLLAGDMVGAMALGHEPSSVPHLVHFARNHGRSLDPATIDVIGETVESVASFHEYDYVYENGNTMPLPFVKAGIKGITYHKYDDTMCTYCSGMNGMILTAIKMAWDGRPFDDVEILTGKRMKPTPGKKKTILVGQCIYNLNKDDPNIRELIPIKGCPPSREAMRAALEQAGIQVPDMFYDNLDKGPMLFMRRYKGNPDFDDSFYQVATS